MKKREERMTVRRMARERALDEEARAAEREGCREREREEED